MLFVITYQIATERPSLGCERVPWTERSPPELDFAGKHHGSLVAHLLYLDRNTKPTHGKGFSERILFEKGHKYEHMKLEAEYTKKVTFNQTLRQKKLP